VQPKPVTDKQASDEELWELAKQGSREAFDLYMERIAERKAQAYSKVDRRTQFVESQLSGLAQRYPQLNDVSHPLAQAAASAYQMLVANGAAASRETLLEAVRTAIADRPDLVSEIHAKVQPRRQAAGQTGAAPQQASQSASAAKPQLSPKQRDLARRMGVTDPTKSMERFYKRQAEGQSALGAVASYVKEDE
jgi:hypothetical protein